MIIALLLLLVALGPAGCSVAMALSGSSPPDVRAIRLGNTRGEIEAYLGKPSSTKIQGDQTICIYKFQVGNKPAPFRAGVHAVLDVATLGLWEFVGTPIELVKGETRRVRITYGPDNRAQEIKLM
jgi:hypothetical protein